MSLRFSVRESHCRPREMDGAKKCHGCCVAFPPSSEIPQSSALPLPSPRSAMGWRLQGGEFWGWETDWRVPKCSLTAPGKHIHLCGRGRYMGLDMEKIEIPEPKYQHFMLLCAAAESASVFSIKSEISWISNPFEHFIDVENLAVLLTIPMRSS